MAIAYKTPGVYREESFRQPEAKLPTGIPGFVGFFQAKPSEKDFPVNTPLALHRQEEFSEKFIAQGYLLEAVTGFFANGGTRCYVVRADSNQEPKSALEAALSSLAPLKDLDLLAVPDAIDQLLITLEYWREYRTYFLLGNSWGINESTAYRIVRKVENILIKSGLFNLPGKKAL